MPSSAGMHAQPTEVIITPMTNAAGVGARPAQVWPRAKTSVPKRTERRTPMRGTTARGATASIMPTRIMSGAACDWSHPKR
eukprot:6204315-Pleurochrysis_carterae.AAC.6